MSKAPIVSSHTPTASLEDVVPFERLSGGQSDQEHVGSDRKLLADDRPYLTFGQTFRFLAMGKVWYSIALLAGIVVAIGFFIYVGFNKPSMTTYRSAISITMTSDELGLYPNGSPFSVSDLRTPVVLEQAYQSSGLASFGITETSFADSISVEAYSPNIETITARFRARASVKGIAPVELKAAEETYRQELAAAQFEGVLITLTLDAKFGVPTELGKKVVSSLPSVWTDVFINTLGVGGLPLARSNSDLIDAKIFDALDYPLALDYIDMSATEVEERLTLVSELPNATNAVIKGTPQGLFDIKRRFDNIRLFQIDKQLRPLVDLGISRSVDISLLTLLSYENKIQVLDVERENEKRKSAAISELIRERSATDSVISGSMMNPTVNTAPPASIGTSITTVGDTVVDRVVALSVSSAMAEFKEKLLNEKLDIEKDIGSKIMTKQLIERRMAKIRASDSKNNSTYIGAFSTSAMSTISELNAVWRQINEILAVIADKRLGQDKLLYSPMVLSGTVIDAPFYRSLFLWIQIFAIIFISLICGVVGFLVKSAVENTSRIESTK